ncbi:cupredoxin domain-containing protein [Aneurinibacillus terranovensis]|uniref:cupredoxin domain-containing protein n=1 Tax=Aneurinibacillus terranovensis TaxID=278991 RepID=UPI000487C5E5|nr:cupredoxin domain-containing protein [Aneurinibacillus terranovensis]
MMGMTVSMSLGMAAGLIGGYTPVLYYSGDLFTSTLLGIIIGGFFGLLSGIPIGLICVLEGFFSGLMSGMMGAMLGDMISPPQKEYLFYIFFVLLLCTVSLVVYLIVQELSKRNIPTKLNVVAHPLYPLFLLVTFFLILPHSFASGEPISPQPIIIEAKEFAYSPNVIRLTKNQPTEITLVNKGNQEHDIEIQDISISHLQINQQSNHHGHNQYATNVVHIHAKPGQKSSVKFTPNTIGTYQWFCTLPGHKESGMSGTLIVKE